MKLITYSPLQTLNKAYRKEKISRESFNHFREQLKTLFQKINEEESEEHLKYPLRDFFKSTFYSQNEINTKGKTDLGIFLDGTDKSKLGVIIEVKKPSNIADMITQTDINKKAMHEAMLYYLRERIDENNNDIKHIIITNLYEWFVFDAHDFERLFYKSNLNKEYVKWKSGQKTSANTPLFYTEIARPFLADCEKEISATWFDLREYQKALASDKKDDERKLTALYKIISDVTLLKEPFANDSNSLDRKFYNELLHIIGLEEVKEGSKKTIKRKANPDHGSLLENTISTLESSEKLHRIDNRERYGETTQEQLFNVSLELVITWINRILFLKLLEGQMVKYHQGNQDFKFLSPKFIADFDELNELFFEVLAKRESERKDYINAKFRNIPYLNSSLFELKQGSLEDNTILVSNLKDRFKLPVYSKTVLTENGKKLTGELSTLKYLLDFIDAYDFSSEGAEEIQEENKSLINASVLGLIFEKINGYKDGSFFTPGFITMYMCRETIRRAVLQKFADAKGWNCETIEQLKDKIDNRAEANEIVNSLKICDPAVGSGHFLVSALNEIIALKSELDILLYRSNGNRVKNYRVEVVNDELVITDKETEEIFAYHLNEKGKPIDYLQEMQETLFHEKQTIIENCLFGVDINPNSVNICRLRLWIELLKNAYYIFPSVQPGRGLAQFAELALPILQTLPNIDINIKCGNSLISRFPLDADLSKALKSIKYDINTYKKCVNDYKNSTNKEEKRSLEILIEKIKGDFKTEITRHDPKQKSLDKLTGEMLALTNPNLFSDILKDPDFEKKRKFKIKEIESKVSKLSLELSELKNNTIFKNSFEWRFEFPEVLDDNGSFLGFDVVIENPPYVFARENFDSFSKAYYSNNFKTSQYQVNLFFLFIEKTIQILRSEGEFSLIVPNSLLMVSSAQNLRKYLLSQTALSEIINLMGYTFEGVNVETIIFSGKKTIPANDSKINISCNQGQQFILSQTKPQLNFALNTGSELNVFSDEESDSMIEKLNTGSDILDNLVLIKAGLKAYEAGKGRPIQSPEDVKKRIYDYSYKFDDNTFQYLEGKDVCRYHLKWTGTYLRYGEHLAAPRSFNIFGENKIIIREITGKQPRAIIATYTEDVYLFNMSNIAIIARIDKSISLKFVLGVLNSKLMSYYFMRNTAKSVRQMFPKLILEDLRKFPFKNPSHDIQKPIIFLVEQILEAKKRDPESDITLFENEIDSLVYNLYGLTKDEIKIIES